MSHAGASTSSASATASSPDRSTLRTGWMSLSSCRPTTSGTTSATWWMRFGRTWTTDPWRYELLVVDDDSPDGTAAVVRTRYGMTTAQAPGVRPHWTTTAMGACA